MSNAACPSVGARRAGTTSRPESATGWRCARPAAQKDAAIKLAARSLSGRWRRWQRVMENGGEARQWASPRRRGSRAARCSARARRASAMVAVER